MNAESTELINPYSETEVVEYTSAGYPQQIRQSLGAPLAAAAFWGLSLLAGTGGVLPSQPPPSSMASRAMPTGAICQIRYSPQKRGVGTNNEDDAPTGIALALSNLQEQFAFNISELSALLQVSRPTVYSWIRGDSVPHSKSLLRISLLNTIAERWNEFSSQTIGSMLKGHPLERRKVMSLLASGEILVPDAISALKEAAANATDRRLRLRERRTSSRSVEARQRSFSEETGV